MLTAAASPRRRLHPRAGAGRGWGGRRGLGALRRAARMSLSRAPGTQGRIHPGAEPVPGPGPGPSRGRFHPAPGADFIPRFFGQNRLCASPRSAVTPALGAQRYPRRSQRHCAPSVALCLQHGRSAARGLWEGSVPGRFVSGGDWSLPRPGGEKLCLGILPPRSLLVLPQPRTRPRSGCAGSESYQRDGAEGGGDLSLPARRRQTRCS